VDLFLQLLARGLITGSLYALLGVSWGIIYNTTRTFHFAHGFVYTLTAYTVISLKALGVPFVPSLLAGLLAAVLAGAAMEYFLTAMGIMIAGTSAIHLIFGPDSRPLEGFPEILIFFGPVVLTSIDLLAVVVSWIVIGLLFAFLSRTKAGMMIRAVSSNPEKATFIGIDAKRVFILVFAIGSLLMGVAAFLATLDKPANPHIGIEALLISFITVFLGGVGSLPGAVLGGMILGIAESLVILILPTEYKMVVTFLILFLVILFKPEGLMGEARAS
jgi:branched-chain amino acid transport system permease protein